MVFDTNRVIEEIEKGDMGNGPLTLIITCCNCNSMFEINRESIAIAIMTNVSLMDYIRYVQNSKCPECNKEKDDGKV